MDLRDSHAVRALRQHLLNGYLSFVREELRNHTEGSVRCMVSISIFIQAKFTDWWAQMVAGKSTFIKLLAGVEIPDTGTIELDTRPVEILNPEQSTRLGLSFIHQELHLVPQFNALQNLTLGLPKPKRAGLIHWPAVRSNVSGLIKRLGINFSLEVPVAADAYLLNAFAAVFLGSATLKDGEFHIPGTLVGVLIIGIGFNGLAIFGAPTFYQYLFQGAILIAAVALSTVARRCSKL